MFRYTLKFYGGGLLRGAANAKRGKNTSAAAAAVVSSSALADASPRTKSTRRSKTTAAAAAASVNTTTKSTKKKNNTSSSSSPDTTLSISTHYNNNPAAPPSRLGGAPHRAIPSSSSPTIIGLTGRRGRHSEGEVLDLAQRMQRRDLSGGVPVASFAYAILRAHPSVRQMSLRERMAFLCERWERLSPQERQEYLDDPLKGLL